MVRYGEVPEVLGLLPFDELLRANLKSTAKALDTISTGDSLTFLNSLNGS